MSDSFSLTDGNTNTISPLFADSITASDIFNSQNTFYRTLSDSVSLSEVIKNNLTKSLADTLSLGDSFSPYWTILRTITDTLTASDNFGIGGTVYHRSLGDSIGISDDLTTKALFKPLVDSVTLGDSFARQWTILKTITDILNASDSITKQTLGRTLEDSISFAEGISNCPKPHISDSVSMSDANTKKIGVKKLETIEFFGPEGRKFKRWNGTAWVEVNTLTVFK